MEQSSTSIETYSTTSRRGDLIALIGLATITILSVIIAVSGSKKKKKNRSKFSSLTGAKTAVFVEQPQPIK